MATLTGTRAASDFPVFKPSGAGLVCAAYGQYDLTANPSAADIFELCKLPEGAVVVGGYLYAEDLDTGAETLDIDVGWAANGTESASAAGFVNSGVLTGDAITDLIAAGASYRPFDMSGGPISFSAETMVQATVNAASATFAAGTLFVVVLYVVA